MRNRKTRTNLARPPALVMLVATALAAGGAAAVGETAAAAAGQPVVFSSDFENGTIESWVSRGGVTLEASDAQAASGEYSLLTTGRTSAWNGPAHNMLDVVEALGVYEFSVSVRLAEGEDPADIKLSMETTSEETGETSYPGIATAAVVTDGAWVEVTGTYEPAERATKRQFYVESSDPTLSYYIDAISVTQLEAPPVIDLPTEESATVDFTAHEQEIDGFGFSQTFGRAQNLRDLPADARREVLDLLLDPKAGMGMTILRLGIFGIQPRDPGGPDADPQYVWDGDDGGQLWLATEAADYGVQRFYADAWSAPGYMKTNGSDTDGGELCGSPGTDCGEDWRQAYADYLVQYAKFYAEEGIDVTDLGFTNEPDFTTSYESMRFDDAQITDFLRVFGPTVERSGLDIDIACCDAAGWDRQVQYSQAIEADPEADRWVDVHTGHSYVTSARGPLPTDAKTWMSEYALPATAWNELWDGGGANSGLALANDIHDTLTAAQVNAYVSWFGASLNNTAAPIQIDGDTYHVSKRLWATAAYSRFVRPGAHRVTAGTEGQQLKISGFRNADGRRVVNVINNRDTALTLDLELQGAEAGDSLTTYRTDEGHDLAATSNTELTGASTRVDLEPRSLTTLVIDDDDGNGDGEGDVCTATVETVGSWPGGWQGRATVTAGDAALDGWDVAWQIPDGQEVSHAWQVEWDQAGATFTASDAGYNAEVPARASRTFGFVATGEPASDLDASCSG
ncbi:hypothetical protein GCM10027059_45100 [Myceligenerans halotolerans]